TELSSPSGSQRRPRGARDPAGQTRRDSAPSSSPHERKARGGDASRMSASER
ncbi:B melanoma antigen 3-like, partial [Daubentonia madagascariensis]